MKQIKNFLLCVTVLATSAQAKKDKDSVLDDINQRTAYIAKTVTTIEEQQKCSTVIMQKDVGTTGYVISSPGDYCLGEDIVFNPATPAAGQIAAAITVSCSNVNLQMKNCRLSLAGVDEQGNISPDQTPFVVGIFIPDTLPTDPNVNAVGIESVYISGDQAIIDGFSMYGIYILGHTADIRLSNITVKNCGKLASVAVRSQNPALANYFPNGFPLDPGALPFAVGGISIGESDIYGLGPVPFTQNEGAGSVGIAQNRVSSVVLDNVTCLNNFFFGINMANVTDVSITDCHFDGTYSDDPNLSSVGAYFGIATVSYENPSLLNMTIENCTFNNTSMGNGDFMTELQNLNGPLGCYLAQSSNISFDNCHFDNTVCTFAGDAEGGVVGGCSAVTVNNVLFENCSFSGESCLSSSSAGFVVGLILNGDDFFGDNQLSHNIRVINCIASDCQQLGNLQQPAPVIVGGFQACGFFAENSSDVLFENCVASDIIVNGPTTKTGLSEGFGITAGPEIDASSAGDNMVLRGCTAQRVITYQGGSGYGFQTINNQGAGFVLRSLTFDNCTAQGCLSVVPTMTTVVQGLGCGFQYESIAGTDSSFPVTYNSCSAMHNKGLPSSLVSGLQGTLYSAGFAAFSGDVSIPVQNHSYYNCQALDNVYGFLFHNDQQMVVRNCQADLNVADDGVTGAGFTDLGLGTSGTPAAPSQSFSLFQSNKAFENGAGSTHFGANGNYNVKYGAAALDNVPTLTGNLTTPNALGGSYFPEANYIAHNLSITQS